MKVLALLLLPGCLAFNEVCPEDTSEVLGETQRSLDVREETLQSDEAAAGNLLADALLSGTEDADVAVVPAGMILGSTPCGARAFIQRGLIRQADIDAMVPTTESVYMVSITTDDLRRIFERSVSALGVAPPNNPAFLQVAGAYFTADCAEAPQALSTDGKSIRFPGSRVMAQSIFVGGVSTAPGQPLKIAVPATLTTGAYGFVDLTRPGTQLVDMRKTPGQMLAEYLRKASPVDPAPSGRILLKDTCR